MKQITVDQLKENLHSGDYCQCNSCGYKGYAYGVAHSEGVSAPYCQRCGINNKLTLIAIDKSTIKEG